LFENGIYLDFQATTPLDPRVTDAMLPWMGMPANAHASENSFGRRAEAAVERSKELISALFEGDPEGVTFTSGATESANLVLRSLSQPNKAMAISAIEHPCVAETAASAKLKKLVTLAVDTDGLVDLEALSEALDGGIGVVSIMAVNNEIGTIQPLQDIRTLCRSAGALLHSDITQGLGKIPLKSDRDFDLATFSAHKLYGPQGIGAVYASAEPRKLLRPLTTGGGQQRRLRPGTVPVALCVGFGEACRLASLEMESERRHCQRLAARLLDHLRRRDVGFVVHGSLSQRIAQNLNLGFPGVNADELLLAVPDLALSTGSACASGAIEPSRVLLALGVDEQLIASSIRIGLGRTTTEAEIDYAAEALAAAVHNLNRAQKRRAVGRSGR
jgi:cysteine desulfurase